jgi:tetratricopeptide (TPR) repeat protein
MSGIAPIVAIAQEHESQGRLAEAAEVYAAALLKVPDDAGVLCALGKLRRHFGQSKIARELLEKAVNIYPSYLSAWCALYGARLDEGDYSGAAQACRQAIAINHDLPEIHLALANMLLMQGDFAAGLPEYEWRLACNGFAMEQTGPRWSGDNPSGKTILVVAEQGFGDALFAARWLPELARRGAKILLGCRPPLAALLSQVAGVDRVIAPDDASPGYDAWVPMLSLPICLGVKYADISGAPYLSAPPDRRDFWRDRLKEIKEKGRAIGLVQSGNPLYANDFMRTPPPEAFAPLLEIENCRFIGLGKEGTPACPDFDWGREVGDFADMAGLVSELDMVITVDTAMAHLAGGLGKPVWIALPHLPDWRWFLQRSDSPWYASARLFRQSSPGDWNKLFAAMAEELRRSP